MQQYSSSASLAHPHQCKNYTGLITGVRSVCTVARAATIKPFRANAHVGCHQNPALTNAHLLHNASNQLSRRALLSAAVIFTASGPASTLAGPTQQDALTEFLNPRQGYRIDRPQQWEQTSKAGADVLFADPANKSTTIGVTVNPIKIASLEKFGDVETVRKRLIATEKQKESTLHVALIQESSRRGKSGTLIYDIEYELNSTRGRKRILSTVGIANKKLFIVNGNFKCSATGCSEQDTSVATLRQVASTFDVVS